MENEFNIGDVVMLNSGGPEMTVVRIKEEAENAPSLVACSWFQQGEESVNGTVYLGEAMWAEFPSSCLWSVHQ